jgi:sugar lactone lactonase YvrE
MGRRAAASLAVLALALMSTPGRGEVPGQSAIREAASDARAAYERKDYAEFLVRSQTLVRLAPQSPRALYNLACAQSLAGDVAGAAAALDRLADWGVAFDLEGDTDFDPIRDTDGFRAAVRRMQRLSEPIGDSPVAFTLPERDLLAEGVGHDPETGDFFVSGVHRRKIVRVSGDGQVRDFVGEGRDGLGAATGLVVDPSRRALWVATEASPLMVGFREDQKDWSFLLEFDLETAALRRRLEPPVPGGRVSDLALGPDGTVYAADPAAGRVYRLPVDAERLEVLVDSGEIVSAQGVTASDDGTVLYVADYARGIARVELATRRVTFLRTPADLLTTGIDGLVLAGDSLVGIQNGLTPNRVVRLRLDPSATRILGGEILERAHPRFDEPTLGVLAGRALYYVANSQYRHFAADGTPDLDRLQEPVVLRLPLPWVTTR